MQKLTTLAILTVFFGFVSTEARASSFVITVDTSPLSGSQTLVLGLTNFNSETNTVSLSDFSFDGGGAIAGSQSCDFGGVFSGLGCSGDLTTGVVLQDVDPIAAFFTQQFSPGSSLSFLLTTTSNFAGGTPDQFSMFLCDATLSTCYSDDPTAAMLLLDLTGGTVTPASFALYGASLQELPAPAVTPVPEPSTLVLLGGALTAGVLRARRRSMRSMLSPHD